MSDAEAVIAVMLMAGAAVFLLWLVGSLIAVCVRYYREYPRRRMRVDRAPHPRCVVGSEWKAHAQTGVRSGEYV